MIKYNDSIRYSNVISKRYTISYLDFKWTIENFLNEVVSLGVHPYSSFFYSINSIDESGVMSIEVFIPVREQYVEVGPDMFFHTYYLLTNMLTISVEENYEQNTPMAYERILQILKDNNLKQRTDLYIFLSVNKEQNMEILVKVGY